MRLYLFPVLVLLFVIAQLPCLAQPTQEEQADSLLLLIAQTNEDTIKAKIYRRLTQMFAYNDHNRSLKYAEAAIYHSRNAGDEKGVADGLANMFNVNYISGAPTDSLRKELKRLEDHVRGMGDSIKMINVYGKYSLYYSRTGQMDQELVYELKTLELIRTYLKDPEAEAGSLANIGVTLNNMEQVDKALEYFNSVLALNVENQYIIAKTHFQLGSVYYKQQDFDSSKNYFDQALAYFEATNNLHEITKINIWKGRINDELQRFSEAEQNYKQAYQLAKQNDIKILLHETYAGFANHYYARENYALAVEFGQKYLAEMAKSNNYFVQHEYLEMLHQSYAQLGQYEEAYQVRDDLAALKDSIKTADHLEQLLELETKFQLKEQKNKNELLAAENAIAQNKLQHTQFIAAALLIAFLLAGGWGYSVFNARKREKQYNQQLEAIVEERTAALSTSNKNLEQANYELRIFNYIASHDIKEPIRNIGNYVSLIQRQLPIAIKENLGAYFSIIKNSTAQIYTLLEDFARYTSLSKDEKIQLQQVDLQLLTANITQALETKIEKYKGQVQAEDLPTIKSNSSLLFSALKNIIENGLKFNASDKPTVKISYNSTNTHHEILVVDNGIGIDKAYQDSVFEMFKRLYNKTSFAAEGSGIGLAIVKLVMDKLDGEVRIKSEVDKGTTFLLVLPQK